MWFCITFLIVRLIKGDVIAYITRMRVKKQQRMRWITYTDCVNITSKQNPLFLFRFRNCLDLSRLSTQLVILQKATQIVKESVREKRILVIPLHAADQNKATHYTDFKLENFTFHHTSYDIEIQIF